MPEAFYEPDGGRYRSTELTRGPWDPRTQHAGPPAALIGREIERLEDAADFQVGRVTFEILRAVPIAPLSVQASIVRPGRRVQLVEAELSRRQTGSRSAPAPGGFAPPSVELPSGESPGR